MMKIKYKKICEQYTAALSELLEIDFDGWIGENIGEVAMFGDYIFDFQNIRYAIDHNVKAQDFIEYYYFCLEYQEAFYNIDAYMRLKRDFRYTSGLTYTNDNFEKHLLYLRINSK